MGVSDNTTHVWLAFYDLPKKKKHFWWYTTHFWWVFLVFVYHSHLWRRGLERLIWVWVEYMGYRGTPDMFFGYFQDTVGPNEEPVETWPIIPFFFGGGTLEIKQYQASKMATWELYGFMVALQRWQVDPGNWDRTQCLPIMVTNSPANQTLAGKSNSFPLKRHW